MTEGFQKYLEKEREVEKKSKEREIFQMQKKIKIAEERKKDLEIKEKRWDLTQNLLEKYPEILKLERYGNYLEREAASMGKTIREFQIVEPSGEISNGHKAEFDLLNSILIKKNQRVLSLRDKSEFSKDSVFEDLIKYYSDDGFQKEEECKLGKFAKRLLLLLLKKENPDLEVSDIRFMTGVGTTLDFNFGVDGWVEITDENGIKDMVYFDMKTGSRNLTPSKYADLLLNVEENGGKVKLEEEINIKNILEFLYRLKKIYLLKRKRREGSKI